MKLQRKSGKPSVDPSNGGKDSNVRVSMKRDKSHEDDIIEISAHHLKSNNNIQRRNRKQYLNSLDDLNKK